MSGFVLMLLAAGLMAAIVSAPFGCFAIWRRMAFFGDSLGHASILGVGIGLLLDVSLFGAVVVFCLAAALLLFYAGETQPLPTDTLLALLAHGGLAFGVLLSSLADTQHSSSGHEGDEHGIDFDDAHGLEEFLFGSLERIALGDLFWFCLIAILALGVMAWIWKPLLMTTLAPDMARVEGVPVARLQAIFMMMLALVIAVEMRVTGALLVSALLIVPAAAARGLAASPISMVCIAGVIGCLSVLGGLGLFFWLATPPGPSIAATAVTLFIVSQPLKAFRR